jgi:invasion protein IalB
MGFTCKFAVCGPKVAPFSGAAVKSLYVNIALAVVALAGLAFGAYEYGVAHALFTRAPAAANAPTLFVKTTDGSWQLRCRKDAPEKCVAAMNVANKAGQLVMVWLVGATQAGGLVMTVQTPTGVVLEPGMDFVLDSNGPHHMAFGACGPAACRANLVLDDAIMDEMRKAAKASATFTMQNGRKVTYTVAVQATDKMLTDLAPAGTSVPAAGTTPKAN